jgi:diamine N-acetyltransferase
MIFNNFIWRDALPFQYFCNMHTGNLTFTVAELKDAERLTALSITTFTDAFAKENTAENMDKYIAETMTVSKLAEEIADKDNLFFLAWYDSELSGYAKIRTGKEIPVGLERNRPVEIERIYVLQSLHGKKIGAALMERCINHAIKNGHDVLWLGVWGRNYKAIRFYEQWGFELFGSHKFKLGDDIQTDVLMKKKLV